MIKTFENFKLKELFDIDHMKNTGSSAGDEHLENYMFFGNLETMKRQIEDLLRMDRKKVDMVLRDGHNWAVDHIVSSKDDIEEVFNFLRNETAEEMEDNIDE